jgi:hypothetical protein
MIALKSTSLNMSLSSPLYIREMSLIFNQTETLDCPVVNGIKVSAEDGKSNSKFHLIFA